MKEANCLERGIRPTLNEPDDLRCSAEPELIAGLIWRALLEIIRCATFGKKIDLTLLPFKDQIMEWSVWKGAYLAVWSYRHAN